MDDFADSVEEIKADKNLFCEFTDSIDRESLVVGSFEDFKKVDSKNLINHTEMIAVGSLVEETVEEIEDMRIIPVDIFRVFAFIFGNGFDPFGFGSKLGYFLKNFDLFLFAVVLNHKRLRDNEELTS